MSTASPSWRRGLAHKIPSSQPMVAVCSWPTPTSSSSCDSVHSHSGSIFRITDMHRVVRPANTNLCRPPMPLLSLWYLVLRGPVGQRRAGLESASKPTLNFLSHAHSHLTDPCPGALFLNDCNWVRDCGAGGGAGVDARRLCEVRPGTPAKNTGARRGQLTSPPELFDLVVRCIRCWSAIIAICR